MEAKILQYSRRVPFAPEIPVRNILTETPGFVIKDYDDYVLVSVRQESYWKNGKMKYSVTWHRRFWVASNVEERET